MIGKFLQMEIETWRLNQQDRPDAVEAMRRLITMGLKHHKECNQPKRSEPEAQPKQETTPGPKRIEVR